MEQTKDEFWVLQTRINQIHLAGQGATDHDMQTLVSLASIANGEIRARKQADAAPALLAACEFWLGAVQNDLGLRLALTSLPEAAGPALVEMLQEAITKAKGDQCSV